MYNKFYKILFTILCVIWMVFIFYNSSIQGTESNNISYKIVNKIAAHDKQINAKPGLREKFNLFVRKNGHALEYMVLSILVALAFGTYGMKIKESLSWVLFICLFYAVTDEFHQLYVPGRQSRVSDVLIDFLGSVIGILIYIIFSNYKPHFRRSLFR